MMNRIAVVSSPRSGNSWIRSVIAGACGMQEIAVHNYLDAPAELPENCFLQIHWYREPNFQRWLRQHQFKVLVVARHPLDILLSILHYVRYEPGTARWLEGNGELPADLGMCGPASPAFLEFCLGTGAENLLAVSYQWWQDANVARLRYEDCVARPAAVLGQQIAQFGGDAATVDIWLQRLSLKSMQATPNRHGWQGTPGLYKKLLPYSSARKIYQRHRRVFDILGYRVGPYLLGARQARANWAQLA